MINEIVLSLNPDNENDILIGSGDNTAIYVFMIILMLIAFGMIVIIIYKTIKESNESR